MEPVALLGVFDVFCCRRSCFCSGAGAAASDVRAESRISIAATFACGVRLRDFDSGGRHTFPVFSLLFLFFACFSRHLHAPYRHLAGAGSHARNSAASCQNIRRDSHSPIAQTAGGARTHAACWYAFDIAHRDGRCRCSRVAAVGRPFRIA